MECTPNNGPKQSRKPRPECRWNAHGRAPWNTLQKSLPGKSSRSRSAGHFSWLICRLQIPSRRSASRWKRSPRRIRMTRVGSAVTKYPRSCRSGGSRTCAIRLERGAGRIVLPHRTVGGSSTEALASAAALCCASSLGCLRKLAPACCMWILTGWIGIRALSFSVWAPVTAPCGFEPLPESAHKIGRCQVKHFVAPSAQHGANQVEAEAEGLIEADRRRH
jgi:hypothetical protein